MLKQAHSIGEQQKRRLQVALDLPPEVEQRIRKEATDGFRSLSKEIAKRLIESVKEAQPASAAA